LADIKEKNVVLGLAIKKARNIEGVTQKGLSHMLDCSQAYVNQMEKGSLGINKFQEVLSVLGYDFNIQLRKIEKVSI
jgi:predicted transcriptional regulator